MNFTTRMRHPATRLLFAVHAGLVATTAMAVLLLTGTAPAHAGGRPVGVGVDPTTPTGLQPAASAFAHVIDILTTPSGMFYLAATLLLLVAGQQVRAARRRRDTAAVHSASGV